MGFRNRFRNFSSAVMIGLSLFSLNALAADTYSVLAYHSVVDESAPEKQRLYVSQTISSKQLISQFNWLRDQGYNVVSWQQIIEAEKGKTALPEKAVLLSFDDGYETMYNVIYPLLKAYNYAAVFAPVSSWINAPEGQDIEFGSNAKLNRRFFVTWAQIAEMQRSGLVEIASHTDDLHKGVKSNPGGSQLAAVVAPQYTKNGYETESQYKSRVLKDLAKSSHYIRKFTGKAPTIMVWPYGAYTNASVEIAKQAGMPYHFSLKEKINKVGDKHVGRFLIDAESSFAIIKSYLDRKYGPHERELVKRSLHIKLEDIYSEDPKIFAANFDNLISKVASSGVSAVYLSTFYDADNDGVVDAAYFPNKLLPVKADIFSRIAWQLRSRADVRVYGWTPASAEQFPVNIRSLEQIKSIYNDLALYSKIDGFFFDGNAGNGDWVKLDNASLKFTKELYDVVIQYGFFGKYWQAYSRNISIHAIQTAEDLEIINRNYDIALIEVPYADRENTALIDNVFRLMKQVQVQAGKFHFVLVSDENDLINNDDVIKWMRQFEKHKVINYGLALNDYVFKAQHINQLKPYLSINRSITRK